MSDHQEPYGIISFFQRDVSVVLGFSLLYALPFAALWTHGNWPQLALSVFLSPVLIWLSIHDIKTFELPDIGTLSVAIVALAHTILMSPQEFLTHLVIAIGVMTFLWLLGEAFFRRTGHEYLGIGDAKLFGAGTLLLGPWHLPEQILLPSLGGIVFHILLRARGREDNLGIPFGPFIAYSIFILSLLDPLFL